MQVAHDVVAAASTALTSRAGSLRHFGRAGMVVFGALSGVVAVANQSSKREASYIAAIAKRDAEITQLKSENKTLEMEKSGIKEKPSSGDPVQDWIDSLSE